MKKKVLSTEKFRILSTKDYSMFNMPDMKISSSHLKTIERSILKKNLLIDNPILVDEDYSILDGKYRFLVAYNNKLHIYYKVSEATNLKDVIKLKHIGKSMPYEDVINVYSDNPIYSNLLKLYHLFDKKVAIKNIAFLASYSTSLNQVKSYKHVFYSGEFMEWDYELVKEMLEPICYLVNKFSTMFIDAFSLCRYVYDFKISNIEADLNALNIAKKVANSYEENLKYMYYNMFKQSLISLSEAARTGVVTVEDHEVLQKAGIRHKFKVYDRWEPVTGYNFVNQQVFN